MDLGEGLQGEEISKIGEPKESSTLSPELRSMGIGHTWWEAKSVVDTLVTASLDAHAVGLGLWVVSPLVLLKLDFTNAFNTVWRVAILKERYDNPDWCHLYRFFWANLSPRARILAIHALSEEGVQRQGR